MAGATQCSVCLTPFETRPSREPAREPAFVPASAPTSTWTAPQPQPAQTPFASTYPYEPYQPTQAVEHGVPPAAKRWNWGAFFLTWIWGIGNGVWIALLALVPLVGLVVPFVLGAKGGEWAWRTGRWATEEQFRATQRSWGIAGAVVAAVMVPILLFAIAVPTFLGARERARLRAAEASGATTVLTSADGRLAITTPASWRVVESPACS